MSLLLYCSIAEPGNSLKPFADSVCFCVQGVQSRITTPDPSRIAQTNISYKEQCELFSWIHAQIRINNLDKEFLPSLARLHKWDKPRSLMVCQLGRDIFKAKTLRGEKPPHYRACIAEAWGFPKSYRIKHKYDCDILHKDVLACNQDYYKELLQACSQEDLELRQDCDQADLQSVVIFPVTYAREWNKRVSNFKAVLMHAIGCKGVGLIGVAEQVGMGMGFVKGGRLELEIQQRGQGPYDAQLKSRLQAVVATHNFPPQQIPIFITLQKLDPCLATAVRNYSKSAKQAHKPLSKGVLTGQELLAEEMSWTSAVPAKYPAGHWQVSSNGRSNSGLQKGKVCFAVHARSGQSHYSDILLSCKHYCFWGLLNSALL